MWFKKTAPMINVSNWEDDLGFLFLIIGRKKEMLKVFFIDAVDSKLADNQSFKDDEIETEWENTVKEIIGSLSENYKKLLTTKYFKDEDALLSFVSEDIYLYILDEVLRKNVEKMRKVMSDNLMKHFNLK